MTPYPILRAREVAMKVGPTALDARRETDDAEEAALVAVADAVLRSLLETLIYEAPAAGITVEYLRELHSDLESEGE